jgi:hypothetical protein
MLEHVRRSTEPVQRYAEGTEAEGFPGKEKPLQRNPEGHAVGDQI